MDVHKTCEAEFPKIPCRFRISSASKQRIIRPESLRHSTIWSKKKPQITSNLKSRSSSLKTPKERVATHEDRYLKATLETQTEKNQPILSEPNEILSPLCKRIQSQQEGSSIKNNMKRIQTINRIFGPKKRADKSKTRETSIRSNQQKYYKDHIKGMQQGKISQLIFENRKKKFSIHKENKSAETEEEFWKRVNESLILATPANEEQESKELREFVENFSKN